MITGSLPTRFKTTNCIYEDVVIYRQSELLERYIPQRARILYPKHKAHYNGEREDLEQAAALAVLEWSVSQPDPDRLSDEALTIIDEAMTAEVRNNQTSSANWDEDEPFDCLDRSYDRELTPDQDALCEHLRNCIQQHIGNPVRVDALWRVLMLEESYEEVAAKLNEGRRNRALVTPLQVEEWVATDTNILRGKLQPDLIDAFSNFKNFHAVDLEITRRRVG